MCLAIYTYEHGLVICDPLRQANTGPAGHWLSSCIPVKYRTILQDILYIIIRHNKTYPYNGVKTGQSCL